MSTNSNKPSKLTHTELAAIDLTITNLQTAGHRIDDINKDDDPRHQMCLAVADAHHPLIQLTERDKEIIAQIKTLASQLSSRTSLPELLEAKGKVLRKG
ncbi:hypothetical protein HI113_23200 [Corallococcus exiguus]|nr:hypothetical protein [Corallococcus exiguus]